MPKLPSCLFAAALFAGWPAIASAGPADAGAIEPDEEAAEDEHLQKDPVGVPPAVQVNNLPKTRHNGYAGFFVMGGATNYDTLPPLKVAGAFGFGFRMGGRIVDAFALGGQLHTIFGLASKSGVSGTFLVEASIFPLKKLEHRGLAVHLGLGAISLTRREPDVNNSIVDFTEGRIVTTGGLAFMLSAGWDFWLNNRFNFGLHGRFDGGIVPQRPLEPSPNPGTRPFVWVPSLELALNWY